MKAGYAVSADSPAEIAEKIADLLNDPDTLAAMRERLTADFAHRSAEDMLAYIRRDVSLAEATVPREYMGL